MRILCPKCRCEQEYHPKTRRIPNYGLALCKACGFRIPISKYVFALSHPRIRARFTEHSVAHRKSLQHVIPKLLPHLFFQAKIEKIKLGGTKFALHYCEIPERGVVIYVRPCSMFFRPLHHFEVDSKTVSLFTDDSRQMVPNTIQELTFVNNNIKCMNQMGNELIDLIEARISRYVKAAGYPRAALFDLLHQENNPDSYRVFGRKVVKPKRVLSRMEVLLLRIGETMIPVPYEKFPIERFAKQPRWLNATDSIERIFVAKFRSYGYLITYHNQIGRAHV